MSYCYFDESEPESLEELEECMDLIKGDYELVKQGKIIKTGSLCHYINLSYLLWNDHGSFCEFKIRGNKVKFYTSDQSALRDIHQDMMASARKLDDNYSQLIVQVYPDFYSIEIPWQLLLGKLMEGIQDAISNQEDWIRQFKEDEDFYGGMSFVEFIQEELTIIPLENRERYDFQMKKWKSLSFVQYVKEAL